MLKTIHINELQPGMMITQVIEQNGPVKIRKVGLVRSNDMITGLAEMGVVRVEIDPEQTVELEPVEVPSSMTQKLLQGEYDHASQVDKSLSDQFNRSLFLPSVSELPSMWQIYMKQAGMAFAVILFGISLGFAGAWVPHWLSTSEQPQSASTAASTDAIESVQPVNSEVAETPVEITDSNTPETDALPAQAAPEENSQPVIISQNQQPEPIEQPEPQNVEDDIDSGELLTQPSGETSLAGVSPDLLERFNRALEDIENDTGPREPETTVSVVNDLPRVDQLPAITLTRLPSMVFSAHMYSSNRDTRWVRVNGQQLFEGDWIERELQLVNIEPQRVVLSFQGELFTMAALTDW